MPHLFTSGPEFSSHHLESCRHGVLEGLTDNFAAEKGPRPLLMIHWPELVTQNLVKSLALLKERFGLCTWVLGVQL